MAREVFARYVRIVRRACADATTLKAAEAAGITTMGALRDPQEALRCVFVGVVVMVVIVVSVVIVVVFLCCVCLRLCMTCVMLHYQRKHTHTHSRTHTHTCIFMYINTYINPPLVLSGLVWSTVTGGADWLSMHCRLYIKTFLGYLHAFQKFHLGTGVCVYVCV